MTGNVDRVITPEFTEKHLKDPLVQPDHRMDIYSEEKSIDRLTYTAGGFDWDNKGREHLKTKKAECECGWTGNTISEAKNHLQEMAEQGKPTPQEIRKILDGVALHGFEFGGLDGHGSSIFFKHQELGIRLYATPMEWLTNEENKIGIQVDGEPNTVFKELQGQISDRVEFEDGLTFKEYLEAVRDYLENNLIRSRWESVDSKAHDSQWENQHNEDFIIIIEETEEDGLYELYSTQGISKCPFDSGKKSELTSKAIHYMNQNPLGLPYVSYQEVIEKSDEYTFRGEQ